MLLTCKCFQDSQFFLLQLSLALWCRKIPTFAVMAMYTLRLCVVRRKPPRWSSHTRIRVWTSSSVHEVRWFPPLPEPQDELAAMVAAITQTRVGYHAFKSAPFGEEICFLCKYLNIFIYFKNNINKK